MNTVPSLYEVLNTSSGSRLAHVGVPMGYDYTTSLWIPRQLAMVLGSGAFMQNSNRAWAQASSQGDSNPGVYIGSIAHWGYNGANFDRLRVIPGSSGIQPTPASGLSVKYITGAAATTVVKNTPGVVGSILCANSTTTAAIQVYNATSATGDMIWQGKLNMGQVVQLQVPFSIGLTVVTNGTTAVTVTYS